MFFEAAWTFFNKDATVAEESAARPRLLPASEIKSRRVRTCTSLIRAIPQTACNHCLRLLSSSLTATSRRYRPCRLSDVPPLSWLQDPDSRYDPEAIIHPPSVYLRCIIAKLVFWAIVGGQEVPRRQVSLRCAPKSVRALVPGRSQNQIMNANLIAAASEVITNQQILVNMVSRRVRQLSLGHRPLVEYAPGLRGADIALTEIANGKLTFESTLGQKGNEPVPHVVQFPEVIVAKKAVAKKKAA
jgi:DNA-directed RNA polymerase subunit omega